jgi:uncharacterized protein (DUF362 family)
MAEKIPRREALSRIASAGALIGAGVLTARLLHDAGTAGASRKENERLVRDFRTRSGSRVVLAVAKGVPEPELLTQRAVEALGGMAKFVARGDIVAIKPNIGWDRLPVHAANTNPRVVAAVVKMAFDAGAKKVIITDASCNEANRSFQRSGIWQAGHELGATIVLPAEHRFRRVRLRGDVLDEWPVLTPLLEADKVVNLPIAKHHNLSKYTGAMKNWYGLLGGRRNRLHQSIDVSIADLATFMRPTLTVLDATRVLIRNGPQGGNIDDAKDMNQVVAGLDEVAVDAYGCALIGQKPESVRYLKLGEERGIGKMRLEPDEMVEV